MIVRSLLDIQTIPDATNVILKPKQVFHHLTTLMHPCAIHAILVQVFFGLLLNNFRFLPSIFVSKKKVEQTQIWISVYLFTPKPKLINIFINYMLSFHFRSL